MTRARQLVVLGTGTGVGKTCVVQALASALATRAEGATVRALKPIESGVGAGADPLAGSDAALLEAASCGSAGKVRPHPLYALPDAISPHLAARRAEIAIELTAIQKWHDAALHDLSPRDWVILETAGGVFSPLSETLTNFDLALALEPAEWLLVAPDALGVLHDVTATLEAMRARGRQPHHLVLCGARPPDASTGSNAAELERLGIATVSAVLPHRQPGTVQALADRLLGNPLQRDG